MKQNLVRLGVILLVIATASVLASSATASGKYKTLHTFKRNKGGIAPLAGLIFDQAGNLYGTTSGGGAGGGTVFELVANADGSWKEQVLHRFTSGNGGVFPESTLVFDQAGNLYGTTPYGGAYLGGTAFELVANADGSWKEKVLHQFGGGRDGVTPSSGLTFDQAGNLYGTTSAGGGGGGIVFELVANADGSWKEKVLHRFTGGNGGGFPESTLLFDQAGNLYGTTYTGGTFNVGTVFRLTPKADGSWTESVLHTFCSRTNCNDGAEPAAGLIFDTAGNLYGTAQYGGTANHGVVFKLAPEADGRWTESVLHNFCSRTNCDDGAQPTAGLIFDMAGNLYGTTVLGGAVSCYGNFGCGVVFKVAPNSQGGWSTTVMHRFADHPGAYPSRGSLIFDSTGNLCGATSGNEPATNGSVFEITP